jgi:fumarylacetoacetate (FAA) hydrolase family protein
MELGGMTVGLREGVIVLITLVAAYIVFVLLRMVRLHRGTTQLAAPLDRSAAPPEMQAPSASEPATDANWEKTTVGLADEMLRQGLEQEVAQLRDEVDAIRGELAALRQDMLQELAHLQAAQAVSPIYGDAMQMAAAGYDAAMIAERCGIARAEAELVVALANSQER